MKFSDYVILAALISLIFGLASFQAARNRADTALLEKLVEIQRSEDAFKSAIDSIRVNNAPKIYTTKTQADKKSTAVEIIDGTCVGRIEYFDIESKVTK